MKYNYVQYNSSTLSENKNITTNLISSYPNILSLELV